MSLSSFVVSVTSIAPETAQLTVVALVALSGAIAFSRVQPAVTRTSLAGLIPWVVVGATVYAGAQGNDVEAVALSPPWVYVVVGGFAALVWVVATIGTTANRNAALVLGTTGTVVALVSSVAVSVAVGRQIRPWWSILSLVAAVGTAGIVWVALVKTAPSLGRSGWLGPFAVFGQTFDGVTTLVGVDVLGFTERVTLSRLVLEFAAVLPSAETLGVGWFFLAVKIAVVSGVLLLASAWEDGDRTADVFMWVVGSVGLGPAVHNAVLYALS